MPRGMSNHTGSTTLHPSSSKDNKLRVSSGRGGSGNIIPVAELAAADLNHQAELLHRRRMERKKEEVVDYAKKQYTGRGGSGNIKAASVAQWISFDKSADPDDSYEDIIVERNKLTPKPLRTGRGGPANGLSKPLAKRDTPGSPFSRLSLPSSNSSSGSGRSSRLSSFTSSSCSSPLGHHYQEYSRSSVFSRFSKSSQQHENGYHDFAPQKSCEAVPRLGNVRWWKRTDTPITPSLNCQTPELVISGCDFFDETTAAVLEVMERFEEEGGEDIVLKVPEFQRDSVNGTLSEDTPPDTEELVPVDELDEDAEWERDVLIQAQHEILRQ